jgi:hypothetical protein
VSGEWWGSLVGEAPEGLTAIAKPLIFALAASTVRPKNAPSRGRTYRDANPAKGFDRHRLFASLFQHLQVKPAFEQYPPKI